MKSKRNWRYVLLIVLMMSVLLFILLPNQVARVYLVISISLTSIVWAVITYLDTVYGISKNDLYQEKMTGIKSRINESKVKSQIGFGDKSILLQSTSGTIYQLINNKEEFQLIRIGDVSSGIQMDLIGDTASFQAHDAKYCQKIKKKDIQFVQIKHTRHTKDDLLYIKNRGRIKRYSLLYEICYDDLAPFFKDITYKIDNEIVYPRFKYDMACQSELAVLPRNKLILIVLSAVSAISSAMFMFMIVNYEILSIICMVLPIFTFGLYLKYSQTLSLSDIKIGEDIFQEDRVNVCYIIFIPTIVLAIRTILDMNILEYKMLIVFSIIVFVILFGLFLFYSTEYQYRMSAIFIALFFAVCYAPSFVAQINYVFDFNSPFTYDRTIEEKKVSKSLKSPDMYFFGVITSDGEHLEYKVSKELYERKVEGGSIRIAEYQGALGIHYVEVIG